MIIKKTVLNMSTANNTSIFSKDLSIIATIICENVLEIEGKVEGEIIGNTITIRETGNVKGNITAKVLSVKGKFVGDIKSERVNVSSKADINGNIEYVTLCVEDGALINGDLKRVNDIKNLAEPKKVDK
jgi:cytoskeletal protein CcmA (bactofilin family)